MELHELLKNRITEKISTWHEKNIYAISFLLSYNESNVYGCIENFPELSIGYNTEEFCGDVSAFSEDRWNYACWEQNNDVILDSCDAIGAAALLKWYEEQGIHEPGKENEDEMYDEDMNYIGKGPNGFFQLVGLVSDLAFNLQRSGIIKEKFGEIPIIIHDLDYSWYMVDATRKANPDGEANAFLKYIEDNF